MISLLFSSPFAFLILIAGLLVSLTIHEFAHAWTADRLGDPTPRSQGRITLNPVAHLDPIGTVLLLFTGFGWGKPVMFDPYNLENIRRDTLYIAAAGPLSNILLALVLALLQPILPFPNFIWEFVIQINLTLAIFNLVPIHPLDGGKILSSLLPPELAYEYDATLQRYGFIILIALVFPWIGNRSAVSMLISPIISTTAEIIFTLASLLHRGLGLS